MIKLPLNFGVTTGAHILHIAIVSTAFQRLRIEMSSFKWSNFQPDVKLQASGHLLTCKSSLTGFKVIVKPDVHWSRAPSSSLFFSSHISNIGAVLVAVFVFYKTTEYVFAARVAYDRCGNRSMCLYFTVFHYCMQHVVFILHLNFLNSVY